MDVMITCQRQRPFLLDDSRFSCTWMGAIDCSLFEGSRTFPFTWNLRRTHTPCYWMVNPASPLWSLGIATHGQNDQRLNHYKGRGWLPLTELMPSTLLLGEERSAPQKFTSAKKEQVRSICLWQYVPVRISLEFHLC